MLTTKNPAIKNELWHWTKILFDWLSWDFFFFYCNILIIFIQFLKLVMWSSKELVSTEEMSYGLNTNGVKLSQCTEDPGYYV